MHEPPVNAPLPTSPHPEREAAEVRLLLEGIHAHYGYDFRDYASASIRRRIIRRVEAGGLGSISALLERVLQDPVCIERLFVALTVHVTSMFRDPAFYPSLRRKAVPMPWTYPLRRL